MGEEGEEEEKKKKHLHLDMVAVIDFIVLSCECLFINHWGNGEYGQFIISGCYGSWKRETSNER